MDAKSSPLGSSSPTPAAASTSTSNESRPKPCCVCKEEKSKRDECMLFSTAKNPEAECTSLIDQYKSCMAGFGYKV